MQTKIFNEEQEKSKKYIDEYNIETLVGDMLNALILERNKSPVQFMITYLNKILPEEERRNREKSREFEITVKKKEIVLDNSPLNIDDKSESLIKKNIPQTLLNQFAGIQTKDGATLKNMLKLSENEVDNKEGITILDNESIDIFAPVINPIIEMIHDVKLPFTKYNFYSYKLNLSQNSDLKLDCLKSIKMEYSRNLVNVPLPGLISDQTREEVLKKIKLSIETLEDYNIIKGKYHQFIKDDKDLKATLKERNIQIKKIEKHIKSAGLDDNWPENRVIYISDKSTTIIINAIDHLNIISHEKDNFLKCFNNLVLIEENFRKNLKFNTNPLFGYINSSPSKFGAGLEVTAELKLEKLIKLDEFKKIILSMNFDYYNLEKSKLTVKSSFKLKYLHEENFVSSLYFKIMSLVFFENSLTNHNDAYFLKLILDEKPDKAIFQAYNNNFDIAKYRVAISNKLNTINKLVKNYNEKPLAPMNFIVSDINQYICFRNFFKEYYNISQKYNSKIYKFNCVFDNFKISFKDDSKIYKTKIEIFRNFRDFTLCPYLEECTKIEEKILDIIKDYKGKYLKLTEDGFKKYTSKNLINFDSNDDSKSRKITPDYPKHRGIYNLQDFKKISFLINDLDHIRIITSIDGESNIAKQMNEVYNIVNEINRKSEFLKDWQFGYLSTIPKFSGTGLVIKCFMKLENLPKNESKLKDICMNYNIYYKFKSTDNYNYEFGNIITMGKTEREIIENFVVFADEIIENDK